MPIIQHHLSQTLAQMKQIYLADPVGSVRSQEFINVLHDFAVDELRRRIDETKVLIKKEVSIYGSHKQKMVDIAVYHPVNGPQIMIGVRSQMSSVHKNLLTYYEEIIGDVISLHDRFPFAVIGYIYLLPTAPLIAGRREYIDLRRAAHLFRQITGRPHTEGFKDKYEHFAFLPVDFSSDPPGIQDDLLSDGLQMLSIDRFFDKILETYMDRNIFLTIHRE